MSRALLAAAADDDPAAGMLRLLMTPFRRRCKSLIPVDTVMFAEFGPDWIGFGCKDHHVTIAFSAIERIRAVRGTLLITGHGTRMVIPDGLVPSDVASYLHSLFGPGGTPRPTAYTPTTHDIPDCPGPMIPRSARGRAGIPGPDGIVRTHGVADTALADLLATRPQPGQLSRLRPTCGERSPRYPGALIRPGDPISAEFGPDFITVRLGGHTRSMSIAGIATVSRSAPGLVIVARGPGSAIGPHSDMIIPDELIPPQVAESLLQRFR